MMYGYFLVKINTMNEKYDLYQSLPLDITNLYSLESFSWKITLKLLSLKQIVLGLTIHC